MVTATTTNKQSVSRPVRFNSQKVRQQAFIGQAAKRHAAVGNITFYFLMWCVSWSIPLLFPIKWSGWKWITIGSQLSNRWDQSGQITERSDNFSFKLRMVLQQKQENTLSFCSIDCPNHYFSWCRTWSWRVSHSCTKMDRSRTGSIYYVECTSSWGSSS